MRNAGRSQRAPQDRHNVADQPGRLVLLFGCALALVAGLTVRGLIHPAKVTKLIEEAAARIHPDVEVTFDGARVVLADGILPALSVAVDHVRLRSGNPCWMAPVIYVNEMRLPLSLARIFTARHPIHEVVADEVELRLTSERPPGCEETAAVPGTVETASTSAATLPHSPPVVGPRVTLAKTPQERSSFRPTGEIDRLTIQRFIVVPEKGKWAGSYEFEDVDFRVRSASPRDFLLRARSHWNVDRSDYLTPAFLSAEYKEFPDPTFRLRVNGNWREGTYDLNGVYFPPTRQVAVTADIAHLPLSQVLALARRWGWTEAAFEPRQSWISLRANLSGAANALERAPVQVSQFRLEGDLGRIESESEIRVVGWSPLRLNPVDLRVESLDFDRLFEFLRRPHPAPSLSHLGRFQGSIRVRSGEDIQWEGEHSGLQFVFANKGRREIQEIERIKGRLRLEHDRWRVDVAEMALKGGAFRGSVSLAADRDLSALDLNLKIDELRLENSVIQLMTNGGQMGPLRGQMAVKVQNRQPHFRGQLMIPSLQIEGTSLEGVQLNFEDRTGVTALTSRISRLDIAEQSPAWAVLRPMTSVIHPTGPLSFTGVSGLFLLQGLDGLRWQRLTARLAGEPWTVHMDGAWDKGGSLAGTAVMRGPSVKRFALSGTRDQPVVREVEP